MLLSPEARAQRDAILAALADVASAGGTKPATAVDRAAIAAFDRVVLRGGPTADGSTDAASSPRALAAALAHRADRDHVVQSLAVMALVDGRVDRRRIERVLVYAEALGHDADGVRDLAELGRGHLAWVRADAQRQNMRSIAGDAAAGPLDAWILPYRDAPDPALAARYRALGEAPAGSLGRAFHDFYAGHGFPFPGESTAVNAGFGTPHDSTHLLSGYDTSPQGELLVSTFTAGMHAREPMSGHVLPVIMSWHLGIELVEFAGSTTGALDAAKFWRAWERGSAVTTDVFAPGWDFWAAAQEPLAVLRARYGVPPLDPRDAASATAAPPIGYKPVA